MKTGLKTILLCFSLLLLLLSTINKVDTNIPGEAFSKLSFNVDHTLSYKNGNFKKSKTIRRYVSGAGLFVVIVVDSDSIVYI